MPRLLILAPVGLGLLYAAACAVMFLVQRALIYHPPARPQGGHTRMLDPTRPAAGEVALQIAAFPQPGPVALLYFGGNGEDVSLSAPLLAEAFPGHAVYSLLYRSYGGSPGKPSEQALIADAHRLFDWVHRQHARVMVIGRSLGSGVAIQVAADRPVMALALVTPFNSLEELAAARFPQFPVRWLLRDRFESWRFAPRVSAPTLLVTAEFDEVVPASSTARLATAFAHGRPRVLTLPGVDHNSITASPLYLPALRAILDETAQAAGA